MYEVALGSFFTGELIDVVNELGRLEIEPDDVESLGSMITTECV